MDDRVDNAGGLHGGGVPGGEGQADKFGSGGVRDVSVDRDGVDSGRSEGAGGGMGAEV